MNGKKSKDTRQGISGHNAVDRNAAPSRAAKKPEKKQEPIPESNPESMDDFIRQQRDLLEKMKAERFDFEGYEKEFQLADQHVVADLSSAKTQLGVVQDIELKMAAHLAAVNEKQKVLDEISRAKEKDIDALLKEAEEVAKADAEESNGRPHHGHGKREMK